MFSKRVGTLDFESQASRCGKGAGWQRQGLGVAVRAEGVSKLLSSRLLRIQGPSWAFCKKTVFRFLIRKVFGFNHITQLSPPGSETWQIQGSELRSSSSLMTSNQPWHILSTQ